ncbi:hypothetical protein E1267_43910, partial [Nonomuraea longispora]
TRVPVQPAWRAVPMDSRTAEAAPRAEAAVPPRNRLAATTGADSGVDMVTVNAFSPLTRTLFP